MRRHRWNEPSQRFLEDETQVRVRFQEVDALRVVWHGHYLSYFEEGRTSLGRKFGIGYQDILDAGFIAPLVHIEIDYLAPARMEEVLTVQSRLHETQKATIEFTYTIFGEPVPGGAKRKLATGMTVQAFTDVHGGLVLTRPAFYIDFLDRFHEDLANSAAR